MVVPHSWHIINNQDAVAKAPKFLVLYKRAGQRVVINANGDMLVRPSFIENSLNSLLSWHGSNGVRDHLLGSYLRSLLAVVLAQFDGKGFPGGMDGAVRLAEKCTPIQDLLLHGAGIAMEDLRRVSRWHGRVVNPKLTPTTAAELVARVQALSKMDAKRALATKVAKEGVMGQAVEAQVEKGSSQGKEEVPRTSTSTSDAAENGSNSRGFGKC
ncbi:g5735 [Coccomyxa elongata]